jgi:hypothetical protein
MIVQDSFSALECLHLKSSSSSPTTRESRTSALSFTHAGYPWAGRNAGFHVSHSAMSFKDLTRSIMFFTVIPLYGDRGGGQSSNAEADLRSVPSIMPSQEYFLFVEFSTKFPLQTFVDCVKVLISR